MCPFFKIILAKKRPSFKIIIAKKCPFFKIISAKKCPSFKIISAKKCPFFKIMNAFFQSRSVHFPLQTIYNQVIVITDGQEKNS